MKKFLIGIVVGILLACLGGIIVFFAMVRLANRKPVIADSSTLVLRLEGEVPEVAPLEIPFPMFEDRTPMTVHDVWGTLRRAAVDPRIKAVVLMPEGVGAGWAKLEEIHSNLLNFKKSGKPLYAYLRGPGTREYYLALAANRIYMAPEDLLNVKGLRAELMYLKGGLDKLGIQVEIEAIGKYKDAGDMFRRTSMTPETREVMNSVLDRLYGDLTTTIATDRKKSAEEVRGILDQGPFLAQKAADLKLVDGLLYEDEMYDQLKKQAKLAEIRKVSVRDYLHAPVDAVDVGAKKRIALVLAEGAILRGDAPDGFGGESTITSEGFAKLLKQVREDTGIQGAIVRIDSPGGDSFASDTILREMKLLSKAKPMVISMGDEAASGGYYISMTGDPIVAYPNTITGSIGVIYGKVNLKGLYDKLGIQKEILTRGRFAGIDSDYKPLNDVERGKLHESIENVYHVFVNKVADARRRKPEEIDELAQGRVWTGEQAKQNGLVDQLGGLDTAIDLVKEKAKIGRDEKVRLVVYPKKKTLFEAIFNRSSEVATELAMPLWLKEWYTRLQAPVGIQRRMPFSIDIR